MRLWIDTDVGSDPDDAVALLCAAAHPRVDLVGVSTVDGDTEWRAEIARTLVDARVVAGDEMTAAEVGHTAPDALLAIGPLTNVPSIEGRKSPSPPCHKPSPGNASRRKSARWAGTATSPTMESCMDCPPSRRWQEAPFRSGSGMGCSPSGPVGSCSSSWRSVQGQGKWSNIPTNFGMCQRLRPDGQAWCRWVICGPFPR